MPYAIKDAAHIFYKHNLRRREENGNLVLIEDHLILEMASLMNQLHVPGGLKNFKPVDFLVPAEAEEKGGFPQHWLQGGAPAF
jgi:hypothetical protein